MIDWYLQEPVCDFEKGEFVLVNGSPRMANGLDELKNWIRKILHTKRGHYTIYEGSDYGTRVHELLVGKSLPIEYVKAEIQRVIKENLQRHVDVISVESFEVSHIGSELTVSFHVTSEFGAFREELSLVG